MAAGHVSENNLLQKIDSSFSFMRSCLKACHISTYILVMYLKMLDEALYTFATPP